MSKRNLFAEIKEGFKALEKERQAMPKLKITVTGYRQTGKTTVSNLIKQMLCKHGFVNVKIISDPVNLKMVKSPWKPPKYWLLDNQIAVEICDQDNRHPTVEAVEKKMLFDPFTGLRRDPGDIAHDPTGRCYFE